MKRKKNIAKAAAAAFIATSLTATVVPVYADDSTTDDVTKDESVYTVLNADGSVSEITVSDILHSDDGFDNYDDTSDLKDVENLKSNDPVKTTNNGYSWTTKNKDIYYQGSSTKDLPLDVDITYTLDGKEMSASDMLGKSGHVQIKINVKNKEKQNYTVNGKTYELGTPFVTVAGAMLDQDKFSNVKINEGTVQSDSSHNIAAAVMVPGLRDGMKDILDADTFKTLDSYLIDDVTIDADVKNFESPSIMLAAATDTKALKDEMKDANLTDVFSQLDELQAATDKLVSGTQSLYDGATSAVNGGNQVNDGAKQLASAVSQLESGAATLNSGASELSTGTSSLVSGLQTLTSNDAKLNSGASGVADGVFALANKVLASQGISTVTTTNYADVLAGKAGITDTQIQQFYNTVKSQANITSDSDLNTLLYLAATTGDKSFSDANIANAGKTATQLKTVEANVTDATAKAANGVNDAKTSALMEQFRTYYSNPANVSDDQAKQAYSTIANTVAKGLNQTYNDQTSALIDNVIAVSCENNATNLANALSPASLQAAVGQVQAGTGPKNGTKTDNPLVNGLAKSSYAQTVANATATPASTLYNQTIQQLISGAAAQGTTIDNNTAALVVSYAANYGNYQTTVDPAGYISGIAANLVTLQNEGAALTNVVKQPETLQLIKSKASDRVSSEISNNSDLKQVKALLDGVLELKVGINGYTAGAESALAGAKQLQSGAKKLSAGTATLTAGTKQLKSGADTLATGTSSLADGLKTLQSGSKTLLDGMKQYNDEGISKLTKNDKISDLKDAADLLDQVKKDGKNYDNYSGISEGTDGSVKFVYKVEGVKETKKNNASDSEKKDNRTFFQRVADLFDFSK